jgi:RHS repeat-associated protein
VPAGVNPDSTVSSVVRITQMGVSGVVCRGSSDAQACRARPVRTHFLFKEDRVPTHGSQSRTTSKTVSGDTTQYVLDLAATLPVVVSDTEAVYLYGLDIIAQQQAERQYYFHDGLGSVRQLLGATGEVEANYAYDPFGVPVVEGDATNPYRFTGEAWDDEVELLYLRARYYQPETGRFITKDPSGGNAWQPTTLNRYVYVTNNPVSLVDVAGNEGEPPPPLPYTISALELGWLWLTEDCPDYVKFDENYHLTQQLMHDQGVNRARTEFHRRLQEGSVAVGASVSYRYAYIPVDYVREAAEYVAGYDRVGFFLGSYVVDIRLNPDGASATFSVLDPKDWESGTRSPCYYAPDLLGRLVNPFLPESLRLSRSRHSIEGLVMGIDQFDFPSDIFLASLLRPRLRGEPGAFGTSIRTGGWIMLEFTWSEPVPAVRHATPK